MSNRDIHCPNVFQRSLNVNVKISSNNIERNEMKATFTDQRERNIIKIPAIGELKILIVHNAKKGKG